MQNESIPTVVAVCGPARSGTSCTAGIIHTLGVSMGEKMRKPRKRNPKGFFEDIPLRKIIKGKKPFKRRVNLLRAWATNRGEGNSIIGGKDGLLCSLVKEMASAWPGMKIIAVDRPIDEIVASMAKVKTFRHMTDQRRRQRAVKRATDRDRDIEQLNIPTLRLPFPETVADPAGTVQKIITFLGITPTDEQIQAAIAFVDPNLRHHKAQ